MAEYPTSSEIAAVAAEWAVLHDAGDLTADEQTAFDAWIGQDTRCLGAFARASAILVSLRRARVLETGVATFDTDAKSDDLLDMEQPIAGRRITRRRMLAFACTVPIVGAVATFGFSKASSAKTYTTARGEMRTIPLPDGSTVSLNTDTTIRVEGKADTQSILLEYGEAFFDIIGSDGRQCVIRAGDVQISAKQTSFSVRQLSLDQPVEITVRLGSVLVQPATQRTALPSAIVRANSRAAVSSARGIQTRKLRPAEVDKDLAWREGMLAFEDMPLAQATAQFERYNDVSFHLIGERARSQTITGLYNSRDPIGFARMAAQSLGLRFEQGANGEIIIRG